VRYFASVAVPLGLLADQGTVPPSRQLGVPFLEQLVEQFVCGDGAVGVGVVDGGQVRLSGGVEGAVNVGEVAGHRLASEAGHDEALSASG
jgi:hypothetical protein